MYHLYSVDEYPSLLERYFSHGHFKLLLSILRVQLKSPMPEVSVALHSFATTTSTYYIAVVHFITTNYIVAGLDGLFFPEDLHEFWHLILRRGDKKLADIKLNVCIGNEEMIREITSIMSASFGVEARFTPTPCLFFEYRKEAHKNVDELVRALPHEFVVDEVREEDVDGVAKAWPYAGPDEVLQIRARSQGMASTLIRAADGQPAAFALLDWSGMIIHVHVLPKFRDVVFAVLADKSEKKIGAPPCYCVVETNETMLKWIPKADEIYDPKGERVYVFYDSFFVNAKSATQIVQYSE